MNSFDPDHPINQVLGLTRREFFGNTAKGLGSMALASLLPTWAFGESNGQKNALGDV